MKTKTHAKLGASTSDIWTNCPGAPNLWEKAPPKTDSSYAAEGTAAHGYLEKILKTFIKTKSHESAKKILDSADVTMRHALKVAFLDFTNLWDGETEVVIEERVDLSDVVAPNMFGTVDYGIINHFGELIVNDYKHGQGVKVWAFKETTNGSMPNSQLMYYALGLAAKYDFNFKSAWLRIIQPRCGQGGPISATRVTMKDLLYYAEFLKLAVYRTENPRAKRVAGPWCRFCAARSICKEGSRGYRNDVRADFDEL